MVGVQGRNPGRGGVMGISRQECTLSVYVGSLFSHRR